MADRFNSINSHKQAVTKENIMPSVKWTYVLIWTLSQVGLWAAVMTPASVGLALRIGDIDPLNKDANYALVSGIGALIAVISNYAFGYLSDRTYCRYGMRRPYILFGALGTFVGSFLMGIGESIPALFIGWIIVQISANATLTTLLSVLTDRVPQHQRGITSGFAGMSRQSGILLGTFTIKMLPDSPVLIFMIPAAFFIFFVCLFVFSFSDKVLERDCAKPASVKEMASLFNVIKRRISSDHSFGYALLSFFLINCTIGVTQTYLVYFAQDYVHVSRQNLPGVVFIGATILNLISCITAPIAGYIADKLGARRKTYSFAPVFMACGVVVLLALKNLEGYYIGLLLIAIGFGFFEGLFVAIATSATIDSTTIGADLGIVNMAMTLPSVLLTITSAILLAAGVGMNYIVLFGGAGMLSVLSLFVIKNIRSHKEPNPNAVSESFNTGEFEAD